MTHADEIARLEKQVREALEQRDAALARAETAEAQLIRVGDLLTEAYLAVQA